MPRVPRRQPRVGQQSQRALLAQLATGPRGGGRRVLMLRHRPPVPGCAATDNGLLLVARSANYADDGVMVALREGQHREPSGQRAHRCIAVAFAVTTGAAHAGSPTDPSVKPPSLTPTNPPLATAQCRDGQFSYAQSTDNICGGHDGILLMIHEPPIDNWWGDGNPWNVPYINVAGSQPASLSPASASSAAGGMTQQTAQPSVTPPAPLPSPTLPPSASAPASCVSISGGGCVTQCADGQWSSSTGPGTCSDHGGEAFPGFGAPSGPSAPPSTPSGGGCGSRGGPGYRLANGQCA